VGNRSSSRPHPLENDHEAVPSRARPRRGSVPHQSARARRQRVLHAVQRGYFKRRITGRPDRWDIWVSPLAFHVTQALKSGKIVLASKGGISRKC
jgi:hypothetical protein